MTLNAFLAQNPLWVALFVVLFIAVAIVEYLDSGRGIAKLSNQQAIKFLDQKKHLLIDLRHYVEFEKGYIRGAKQIAIDALKSKPHEHIKKKDMPILLVDDTEFRAVSAAAHLKRQGFAQVQVLKGGMQAWKKENLPLVKEPK